jgi:hypothetical protein
MCADECVSMLSLKTICRICDSCNRGGKLLIRKY